MTNNPIEKIREVVENMHEVAYHSRLSLPTGTREQCARWCNEEFVIPLLDALIEEIEGDLHTPSYVNSAYDAGAHSAKYGIIEMLQEARNCTEKYDA